MHPILSFLLIAFLFVWSIRLCQGPSQRYGSISPGFHNTISVSEAAAEGLDLQAVHNVVKKAKDAKDLEYHLNQPDGINNLDLNDDKQVDYIKVTEYGNKTDGYGFSLTVEPEAGQVQEVATIEIVRSGDRAEVQVRGNETIYGHGHHYSAGYGIGTFLLWSYLLSPHPFYYSPFRYGYYPSYYSPYSTVPRGTYRSRSAGYRSGEVRRTSTSGITRPKTPLKSPNQGKNANSGIRKSLRNPTASQKAFQTRDRSRSVRSGGFGRSTSRSVRGASRGRSFGGFGK